jgi:dethiobiotin synthetase
LDLDTSRWGELSKARGLFITGTDTEVGKTVVAGAIARQLRMDGQDVEVFKPAASGCWRDGSGQLVSGDAAFLAACADSQRPLAEITPVRFQEPLAPNVAAARAEQAVDLQAIFDGWRRIAETGRTVIVEGVGGLLCPISDDFWVIHLARMLAMPVVIVARPDLGTINHTLLTVHTARSAGLNVAGVVINRMPVDPDPRDIPSETNPEQIALRGDVEVLTRIPNDKLTDLDKARLGPETQLAISRVDWAKIINAGG